MFCKNKIVHFTRQFKAQSHITARFTRRYADYNLPQEVLASLPVSLEEVEAARVRIAGLVKCSPLQYSPVLSNQLGNKIYLKMENLQMTGSYKERGALNKLLSLSPEEKSMGVITSSAGNHAQGLSYHATRLGIDAKIVMPQNTPLAKVTGTKKWGAKIVLHGQSFDDAFEEASRLAELEGRTFIHAFNDPYVVAGQGTIALEILEQNPYLDAIVCPIGGGGLIAGLSLVMKSINPRVKIIGVQTANMPSMQKSVEVGEVTAVPYNKTLADGIAVKKPGPIPFSIIKHCVDEIVTVTEDQIASGVLTLLEVEKTIVEGSGAAAIAALASGQINMKNKKIVPLLTGGNIDVTVLGRIIERGLVKDGRMVRIMIDFPDAPGVLSAALQVVGRVRCNVREVEHERAFVKQPIGITQISLTLETRGLDHIEELMQALHAEGFNASIVSAI